MSYTQDFFTSRNNFGDGNTRIGQTGRLWYDSITNTIRVSDGVTPGGIIISASGGGGGTGAANIAVYEEGGLLTTAVTSLNFVGNSLTASVSGSNVTVTMAAIPTAVFDGGSPSTDYTIGGPAFDCGGVI